MTLMVSKKRMDGEIEEHQKHPTSPDCKVCPADDPRTMTRGFVCTGTECGKMWRIRMSRIGKEPEDEDKAFVEDYGRTKMSCEGAGNCISFDASGVVTKRLVNDFIDLYGSPKGLKTGKAVLGPDSRKYADLVGIAPVDVMSVSLSGSFSWTDAIDSMEEKAKKFIHALRFVRYVEDHEKYVVHFNASFDSD